MESERHHARSRSPRKRHRHRDQEHFRDRSSSRRRRSHRSRSPRNDKDDRQPRSPRYQRSKKPLPSQDETFRGQGAGEVTKEKEKANFQASGLLAADANKITVRNGDKTQDIVLKYHEPPETRKPPSSEKWMLYVFKPQSKEPLQTVELYTRSCWLLGREVTVADIPTEHPSCSKQHAVFQFRHIVKKNEWGEKKGKVRLYLLDLESSNGTFLNDERITSAKYFECRSNDVVRFGLSDREYVLLLPPSG